MHKIWKDRLPYLDQNVGVKKLPEMAEELGVNQEELRLFLHRSRRFKVYSKDNLTIRLITSKFTFPEYFMPTKQFFQLTGIRQGRWWQLYKGERKITEKEYSAICRHLKITGKEAMDVRQLDLFENI